MSDIKERLSNQDIKLLLTEVYDEDQSYTSEIIIPEDMDCTPQELNFSIEENEVEFEARYRMDAKDYIDSYIEGNQEYYKDKDKLRSLSFYNNLDLSDDDLDDYNSIVASIKNYLLQYALIIEFKIRGTYFVKEDDLSLFESDNIFVLDSLTNGHKVRIVGFKLISYPEELVELKLVDDAKEMTKLNVELYIDAYKNVLAPHVRIQKDS